MSTHSAEAPGYRDPANPRPGDTFNRHELRDLSERRPVLVSEFYEGVAHTIAARVQALRKQAQSENVGIEAMTLAAHLMDRASEPSFLQGGNELSQGLAADDKVRYEISAALGRAVEVLLDAPKFAGQRVLLFNGEDCTPEQALVINTELERLLGTAPTENPQEYATDIDGVGIIYQQLNSNDPQRRKIEMTFDQTRAETRDFEAARDQGTVMVGSENSRRTPEWPEAPAANATTQLFADMAVAVPSPQETYSDGIRNAVQNAAVLRERLDIRADHAMRHPVPTLEDQSNAGIEESLTLAIGRAVRFAAPRRGEQSLSQVVLYEGPIHYQKRPGGSAEPHLPTEDPRIALLMSELQWLLGANVSEAEPHEFRSERNRVSSRISGTDIDPRIQFVATHMQGFDEHGQPRPDRFRIMLQTPPENRTAVQRS